MACVAARTERGSRPTNEDACCALCAQTPVGEVAMGVVCDGVGGLEWGEVASSAVVARLVRWFERALPRLVTGPAPAGLPFGAVRASLERELDEANGCLLDLGRGAGAPLATTATCVLACDGQALVAHVGDCRALRVGRCGCAQLTSDQRAPGRGSALLQAVGARERLVPAVSLVDLAPGDAIAICSDGVWGALGNGGVARALAGAFAHGGEALEACCSRLVSEALARGGGDNATAVCLLPEPLSPDALPTMACGPGTDEAPTLLAAGS